jgi:predicted nuclease with TOPRIM domain
MRNVEDNIKILKAQRNLYRNEFDRLNKEVTQMLRNFNSDEGEEVVSVKELESLEDGVPYYVNEKVMFIKQISTNPNVLEFHTYMKPGGKFGKQSHDVVESCEIVKGKLIEALREDKIYLAGETVTYDKFEVHKPYTDEVSIYHVTFLKDTHLTPNL